MSTRAAVGTRSQSEWWLVLIPAAAGVFFGLGVFIFGGNIGAQFGFPGNDSFVYRLAGAATLGYPVALALGLRQQRWSALRLPVIAVLGFNLASLFACAIEILGGSPAPVVYLITVASLLFVAISARLLTRYADEPRPAPDVAPVFRYALVGGGLLAAVFGVLPLLLPAQLTQLVGYLGTDVFIIRQAGAASFGYAIMTIWAIRSPAWAEVRSVTIMGLIFNGLGFVAALIAFLSGDRQLIVYVIGAAGLLYTILCLITLQREGK